MITGEFEILEKDGEVFLTVGEVCLLGATELEKMVWEEDIQPLADTVNIKIDEDGQYLLGLEKLNGKNTKRVTI